MSVLKALQQPAPVDVSSPKKIEVDKKKEACVSTTNTRRTLKVIEHGKTRMLFHFM